MCRFPAGRPLATAGSRVHVLFNVWRPVLNEAGERGGVKTGEGGGRTRNLTPRAKADDEGRFQESPNFPSRAV